MACAKAESSALVRLSFLSAYRAGAILDRDVHSTGRFGGFRGSQGARIAKTRVSSGLRGGERRG